MHFCLSIALAAALVPAAYAFSPHGRYHHGRHVFNLTANSTAISVPNSTAISTKNSTKTSSKISTGLSTALSTATSTATSAPISSSTSSATSSATSSTTYSVTSSATSSTISTATSVPTSTANSTADTSQLKTWWHQTGEINTGRPVQDGHVRQSHLYNIQVATASVVNSTFYNSFAYESIPGNGMGTQNADGIGTTMAWSSFLYTSDVTVKITRNIGAVGNYIIRPTNLDFVTTTTDGSAYITVPYNPRGYRFSVEFDDDIEIISGPQEPSPKNALLIFASPFEDSSIVASPSSSAVVVEEGRVTGLNTTSSSTVIFPPGVYYCTGNDHLNLSSSVTWVYFAPGAYVKGAVQYSNTGPEVKATGHGVLSGEQYVWYAVAAKNYTQGNNNDGLRMWSGITSQTHQTFTLHGPTINAPPFNSMDWQGDTSLVTTNAKDYKQVGSFYGQTDGLEFFPGSSAQDIFYYVNDDTIKTYYSNINLDGIVVWKLSVAPVVQFGWASRALFNISINDVSVIHQSYKGAAGNPGLIGADNAYWASQNGISSNHNTADVSNTMQNVTWSNFRAEGPSACLFRIYPLQNLKNLVIKNAWIEQFAPLELGTTSSLLPVFWDVNTGAQVSVSNFVIDNFVVGTTKVTAANAGSVGQIDVDPVYASSVVYE